MYLKGCFEMMTNLQKEIQKVFKRFPEYWDGETLQKTK